MNARTWTRRGSRLASLDTLTVDAPTVELAVRCAQRRWPELPKEYILLAGPLHLEDVRRVDPGAYEVDGLPDGWAVCWGSAS